jgi:hypothetical protein
MRFLEQLLKLRSSVWLDEIVLGIRLMVHAAEILTVPLLFPYV